MEKGSITIIIPCRNEEKNIADAIKSIGELDYPTHLIDIIVCEGMSTDNSRLEIEKLLPEYPNLRLIINEKKITPVAFNLGILNSNSEFIQILGARSKLSKNYIKKATEILNDNDKIVCVGGVPGLEYDNYKGRLIIRAMRSKFGVGGSTCSVTKSDYTDSADIPIFKRWIFDKVGLFDEELVRNQDDELSYRIRRAGYKIYSSIDIQSEYKTRDTFQKLSAQYFQYGYWKIYVNKKHHTFTTFRQLIPALFVLYLFLGAIFFSLLHIFILYPLIFAAYLVAGHILNTGEGFMEKIKVQYVIFIMHISYGVGYLKGIWHFIILNKNPSDKHKQITR